MAHLPTPEKGKMNPGYNVLMKQASTQTEKGKMNTGYNVLVKHASTQTNKEDFVKHASTQANKEDFAFWYKKSNASTEMIDEDLLLGENERKESTHQTIKKDPSTPTTEGGFSFLKAALLGKVLTPKAALSASQQINYKGNTSAATSKNSEQNRKRNVSSDQMPAQGTHVSKQSRSEMGEIIGAIREKKSFLEFYLRKDTSVKSKSISLNQRRLNDPKSRSHTQQHSHSQEMQAIDYSGNRISIMKQAAVLNMNISPNENLPAKFSDSEGLKVKKEFSVHDSVSSVPSVSHCHENILQSNSRAEKLQNMSPLKPQITEGSKDTSMCMACEKKTISEHATPHGGKLFYFCCQCRYKNESMEYLLKHISEHSTEPFYCEVCAVRFSEKGSHDYDQTCDVCQEMFKCKNQLEIHYLIHKKFHKRHCVLCKVEIEKSDIHWDGKDYSCCVYDCHKRYKQKYKLVNHLFCHYSLKLYKCILCRKSFKSDKNLKSHLMHAHPKCKKCGKNFFNNYVLEKHVCVK